jgi:hypothetical protein
MLTLQAVKTVEINEGKGGLSNQLPLAFVKRPLIPSKRTSAEFSRSACATQPNPEAENRCDVLFLPVSNPLQLEGSNGVSLQQHRREFHQALIP